MKSRQVDKKTTFQVRVDLGWKKILQELRARTGYTFKALVELAIGEMYTGKGEVDLIELFGEDYDSS